MTYQAMIEKAEKKHCRRMTALHTVPEALAEMVTSLSDDGVFMRHSDTIDDILSILSGYHYKLESYYMGFLGLAIQYGIDGVTYTFVARQAEEALERLSKGKCKIVTEAKEETHVVCNMEE